MGKGCKREGGEVTEDLNISQPPPPSISCQASQRPVLHHASTGLPSPGSAAAAPSIAPKDTAGDHGQS